MTSSLIDDICGVWDDGADRMPCNVLLARLRTLRPRTYAGWDAHMFGRAMRMAGAPTKTMHFGPGTRRGVPFDVIRNARAIHEEVVYFVERHGFVKIGTTRNLSARLAALDRGSSAIPGMTLTPVVVLATMPGDQHVERAIHQLFEYLRYDGEWFLFEGALVPFVKAVAEARESGA